MNSYFITNIPVNAYTGRNNDHYYLNGLLKTTDSHVGLYLMDFLNKFPEIAVQMDSYSLSTLRAERGIYMSAASRSLTARNIHRFLIEPGTSSSQCFEIKLKIHAGNVSEKRMCEAFVDLSKLLANFTDSNQNETMVNLLQTLVHHSFNGTHLYHKYNLPDGNFSNLIHSVEGYSDNVSSRSISDYPPMLASKSLNAHEEHMRRQEMMMRNQRYGSSDSPNRAYNQYGARGGMILRTGAEPDLAPPVSEPKEEPKSKKSKDVYVLDLKPFQHKFPKLETNK